MEVCVYNVVYSLNQLIHLTDFYCLLNMQGTVLSAGGRIELSNSLAD